MESAKTLLFKLFRRENVRFRARENGVRRQVDLTKIGRGRAFSNEQDYLHKKHTQ